MRTSAGKSVASALCLALFLFLQTLAATPVLHQLFHDSAGQPDHHCVITLLTDGHVQAPSATLFIAPPAAVSPAASLSLTPVALTVDYRLLPGRAPPLSFLPPVG